MDEAIVSELGRPAFKEQVPLTETIIPVGKDSDVEPRSIHPLDMELLASSALDADEMQPQEIYRLRGVDLGALVLIYFLLRFW